MKNIAFILCLCFSIFKTQAQKKPENQLGAWYMYNGSHKLTDKFAIKTMAHFRYFKFTSKFQQEIYRLGVNYKISKKTSTTLGVSYATADLIFDIPSPHLYEWRLYEDFFLTSKWGNLKAKHRFRLEHRFIHKNTTIDETKNWIRYDLNIQYPFAKNWSIYVFNEIFMNLDSSKRFAQNWTGGGIINKLNKQLKLRIGYFQIKTPSKILKRIQLGVILNTIHRKK